MPFFSIVIPTYKNEKYLPECLESIQRQSFDDWEAVVVIDGSPDDSFGVATRYAEGDARIHVLNKEVNGGTHRARMSGVETSEGDYIILLDADDTLPSGSLTDLHRALLRSSDADMLHYGINVIGVDINETERVAFESYINRPCAELRGNEILEASCVEEAGYRQDWRVTQRAYSSKLLKRAFGLMTHDRLGRAQDGYEYFVIACCAQKQITRNDIVALDYFYGRGLNGDAYLSTRSFLKSAQDFQATIDAIRSFSAKCPDAVVLSACEGATSKLLELLMNDWHVRLSSEDKLAVLPKLSEVIGFDALSAELMRFVRDDAYALWCSGDVLDGASQLDSWANAARSMRAGLARSERYEAMRDAAERHLAAVHARTERWAAYRKMPIRIFVSTHKDVDLFESDILQPVQVGAVNASAPIGYALRDCDGENISELNPMYCELTTQYWAWKNVDAEYYGFCHYRRYFDFSLTRHEENPFGEIMHDSIDESAQREFCLDDENIAAAVSGYDVITTEFKDLRGFPEDYSTPWEHYDHAPHLHIEDLELVMRILGDMHPDYVQDADDFLLGNTSCFCNMFIMRKEVFNDYCSWLFPILERYMDQCNMRHYGREARRTPGHLSERLFNIYYRHQMRVGAGWKTKQLQCVHFTQPERTYGLEPVYSSRALPVIPVVLAADDAYVPMLNTTVYSMLKNASKDYHYDVIVLGRGIDQSRRAIMTRFLVSKFPNVTLRFIEVGPLVASHNLKTNNAHIGIETYYRFLIQGLLPFYDKVLYLDSDLIVEGDVSELYSIDLGDCLLAAAHDIDYLGNLNLKDGKRIKYSKDVLGLDNPYGYFQAGVLLLNTRDLRDFCSVEDWLDAVSSSKYIYDDQDVLNARCQDKVRYLPYEWNVMIDCGGRVANLFSIAPVEDYEAYLASKDSPKVVHYAGVDKPWKDVRCDESVRYWSYARETPFYEELVDMLCRGQESHVDYCPPPSSSPARAISEESPIRRVVDPLLPLGSRRREVLKALGRAIRRR